MSELKITMQKMKNLLDEHNSKLMTTEEKINKYKWVYRNQKTEA